MASGIKIPEELARELDRLAELNTNQGPRMPLMSYGAMSAATSSAKHLSCQPARGMRTITRNWSRVERPTSSRGGLNLMISWFESAVK
jgi:hypothetical protein